MPAAIVTGSSGGIGRGIALRLAEDGFDVVVNDIDRQKEKIDAVVEEIKSKGGKAIGFVADVSQKDQVEAMVEAAVKEFGSLGVGCLQRSHRNQ
jgi:meso-butanediol dehydrogenase/(S,S)-butanediol dehydrogenase/diacetyl reductase